jgi:predicted enzyme related to lactoylglutathione lyase
MAMVSNEFSVAVMVSDAKKSAKWYREMLKFETSEEGHWVTAWPKGANWKLHLCQGELEPGNTGIALYSEDLKGEAAKLKARGVKFTQGYSKSQWGENATIADPDGNEITLSQGSP